MRLAGGRESVLLVRVLGFEAGDAVQSRWEQSAGRCLALRRTSICSPCGLEPQCKHGRVAYLSAQELPMGKQSCLL